eukprot:TRINITY_DN72712_c0_g1_i1.p1 TRINITY_DN72712_c0_g1~~TRINITY_DN72712_c0_g1_i1.p1  ORF type:complete len:245 (-),score=50.66 TRINITY_DN72712_c0_g1_i1:40-732(-)
MVRRTWLASALVAALTLRGANVSANAADASKGSAGKAFVWPDAAMGQRTPERVSAGKRAAKYIACDMCEERIVGLFAKASDAESVTRVLEDDFGEALGDAKKLCGMRDVAKLLKARRLEVVTKPDGTAALRTSENVPFYEEINTSDLVFHWKSLAVQHACMEVFRRDGDAVAEAFAQAYREKFEQLVSGGASALDAVRKTAQGACRQAKSCRWSAKLLERSGASSGGGEL